MDPADRKDHDTFRIEVTATADRQRLKRDLVADAFDEDDGMGTFRLRQRQGSRLGRGGGPAHVTSKDLAGKLAASGDIHLVPIRYGSQPHHGWGLVPPCDWVVSTTVTKHNAQYATEHVEE